MEKIIDRMAVPTATEGVTPAMRTALAAIVAVMLGGLILYGTGFANSATLHNAAHDARHGFSFPCH